MGQVLEYVQEQHVALAGSELGQGGREARCEPTGVEPLIAIGQLVRARRYRLKTWPVQPSHFVLGVTS
jgi:hypothetical protein